MKISIDTREDSPDEIKKVITMLNHLIAETGAMETFTPQQETTLPQESEQAQEGFFNLFNDPAPTPQMPETPEQPEEETFKVEQKEKTLDFSKDIVPY